MIQFTMTNSPRQPNRSKVVLTCGSCKTSFERNSNEYKTAIKKGQTTFYCSQKCNGTSKSGPILTKICRGCKLTFSRIPHGTNDKLEYCSKPCFYNARRKYDNFCPICLTPSSGPRQSCHSCIKQITDEKTLGELKIELSLLSFHAKVRGLARSRYNKPKICAACGYNLHVDICHIKPVASFSDDTKLLIVNDPNNLIALDKRCHWEFDHGFLTLEQIMVAGFGLEPKASDL